MKKAIVLILAAVPMIAVAKDWEDKEKPVICGPFREIVEILTKAQYQEFPIWVGKSSQDSSRFSVFRNPITGAWTLVQYGKTTGCILGLGDESELIDQTLFTKSPRS